jgi:hypothetical protein
MSEFTRSNNGEDFIGIYDTAEEAIQDIIDEMEENQLMLPIIYIGESVHPVEYIFRFKKVWSLLIENFLDKIDNACYDEIKGEGEHFAIPKVYEEELGEKIKQYLVERARPIYCAVDNIVKYELGADGNYSKIEEAPKAEKEIAEDSQVDKL